MSHHRNNGFKIKGLFPLVRAGVPSGPRPHPARARSRRCPISPRAASGATRTWTKVPRRQL